MKKVGLSIDELFVKHDNGMDHPESPDRVYSINDMLHQTKLIDKLILQKPRDANESDIYRVHKPEYFNKIRSTKGKGKVFLDQDTSTNQFSFDAALRASGSVLENIDNIIDKNIERGFCISRPPGHHAESDRAMGFCLFNHIAVGAAYLRNKGYENILVVDFDVHHGNGTQHIFESDNHVLYFSTHQYPYYPGTGALNETGTDQGMGYTVNIPLTGGLGDDEHLAIYNELLIPVARKFKPQFILVSAGFDSHAQDPLAGMKLSSECFAKLTRLLLDLAYEYSSGNILFLLEGGYDLNALWESTNFVFNELLDLTNSNYTEYDSTGVDKLINQVRKVHEMQWNFG